MLAKFRFRVIAQSIQKVRELLVSGEPANEVIRHSRERVIAAEPIVKRFLLLRHRR
jgi:hypothetical protein